jgi:hypothetical protein
LSKSVKLSLYFRQVSLLKARFKVRSFLTRYQNTVWSTPGRTVLSSAANLFAPRFSRWTERETLSTRVAKRTDVVKFTRKKSCLLNFLQFIWVIKRILFSAARLGGVRLLAVALLSLEKRWGYISLSGPFIFCGVKFQGLHWRVIIISFIEKYSLKAFGFFEKFGGHPFVLLKIAQYFSPYVGQKHFKQAWPWESLPVQALISKAQDRFRRWFKHVDCGKLNIVLPPATCGKRKSGSGANIGCHLLARDVTPYHKLSVNYEYFSYSPCFLYPRCKTMSVAARKLYIVRTRRHLSARTRLKFVQSLSCTIKPGNLWEIASLFIELANTLSYAEIIKYFSFRAKIQKNAFRNCFFFRYTIWRGLSNESFKIVSQRIF